MDVIVQVFSQRRKAMLALVVQNSSSLVGIMPEIDTQVTIAR